MSQEQEAQAAENENNAAEAIQEKGLAEKLYGSQEDDHKVSDQDSSVDTEGGSSADEGGGEKKADAESNSSDSIDQDEKGDQDDSKSGDEDFSLTADQDSLIGQDRVDEIARFAKEQGLSKEIAEQLVQREENLVDAFNQNLETQREKTVEGWAKQCEEHPVYGGDKYEQSKAYARSAIQKFVPERIQRQMIETGLGNNPDYFEVFARIGEAMKDDSIEQGAQPANAKRSLAQRLYPSAN